MAVQLSASGDYIDFGDVSAVNSLTQLSICAWIYSDTDVEPASTLFRIVAKENAGLTQGWNFNRYIHLGNAQTKSLAFNANWSTGQGQWFTPANSIALNTLYFAALTYNAGSTSNNPAMYINAVSQSVTKVGSPTGVWSNNTGNSLTVSSAVANKNWSGRLQSIRIYSGILTAANISTLYALTKNNLDTAFETNLKFDAELLYAANRYPTIPFASALGGTDYTYDRINNTQGTPHGSPTGAADMVYGTGF